MNGKDKISQEMIQENLKVKDMRFLLNLSECLG